ncbi:MULTISPECIES: class I SAM-dependent methyltransferase [Anaeromyxobacter]|uniref:class I SAM-dependent methyltransferase n=1 Tax=Anaeromyxobacter TaxID=161492 RepID=UPI001F59DE19|nr:MULTISPECIES: class I SAM-dependent methyltransferase [unclassified Anaeromyxobacter]
MTARAKAYKGVAMEGLIASWYTRNTGRDRRRFVTAANAVAARVAPGGRVLEVAPGPGYLAIELAKRGYAVTGLDISRSFVRIAGENAARAGVSIEFRHGNAAELPFPEASFDFAVCMAAFKNFADPVGALDELHRVLRPGGRASIFDLRRDAPLDAIDAEVRAMNLTRLDAFVTRWTFRHMLLKSAYSREDLEQMSARSRFGGCEIAASGVGFELRLTKSA